MCNQTIYLLICIEGIIEEINLVSHSSGTKKRSAKKGNLLYTVLWNPRFLFIQFILQVVIFAFVFNYIISFYRAFHKFEQVIPSIRVEYVY